MYREGKSGSWWYQLHGGCISYPALPSPRLGLEDPLEFFFRHLKQDKTSIFRQKLFFFHQIKTEITQNKIFDQPPIVKFDFFWNLMRKVSLLWKTDIDLPHVIILSATFVWFETPHWKRIRTELFFRKSPGIWLQFSGTFILDRPRRLQCRQRSPSPLRRQSGSSETEGSPLEGWWRTLYSCSAKPKGSICLLVK